MRRQSGDEYDHHAGVAFLNSGFDKFIEYDEHRGAEAYSSTNDYSIEIIDIKPFKSTCAVHIIHITYK